MKKKMNIVINDYVFATLVEQGGKALVYFRSIENENECMMIPFINGFEETSFLMNCFGIITKWYKGVDAWRNSEISIVSIDKKPMALVDKKTKEICVIKSPIFTHQQDMVIQNGNLIYLEQVYGLKEEQFKISIKKELQEEKTKVYQKKYNSIHNK